MPEINKEKTIRTLGFAFGPERRINRKPLIIDKISETEQKITQQDVVVTGAGGIATTIFGVMPHGNIESITGISAKFDSNKETKASVGALGIGIGRQTSIIEDGKLKSRSAFELNGGIAGIKAREAIQANVELAGLSVSITPVDAKKPQLGKLQARAIGIGGSFSDTKVISDKHNISKLTEFSLGHASASSTAPNSLIIVGHTGGWNVKALAGTGEKAHAGAQLTGLFFSRVIENTNEVSPTRTISQNSSFSVGAGFFSAHGAEIAVQAGPFNITAG